LNKLNILSRQYPDCGRGTKVYPVTIQRPPVAVHQTFKRNLDGENSWLKFSLCLFKPDRMEQPETGFVTKILSPLCEVLI